MISEQYRFTVNRYASTNDIFPEKISQLQNFDVKKAFQARSKKKTTQCAIFGFLDFIN